MKIRRYFTSGAFMFLLLLPAARLFAATAFLWEVQSNNTKVFLLGSVHLAKPSMYPLSAAIEAAYAQSDRLVVEVNESQVDQTNMQSKLQSKGMYPGSEKLEDHIDKDTLKQLKLYLNKLGVPYSNVSKMKPGLLSITLSVMQMIKMGYSPNLGIDKYFINRATNSMPVLELESVNEQIDLLLSFSDDGVVLRHTLVSLEQMESMVNEMIAAWRKGDVATMEKIMVTDMLHDHPEFKPLMKRLLTDRNKKMAEKIAAFLTTENTYFVVVGAGHLVGDDGIVRLLEKKGYKIRQL